MSNKIDQGDVAIMLGSFNEFDEIDYRITECATKGVACIVYFFEDKLSEIDQITAYNPEEGIEQALAERRESDSMSKPIVEITSEDLLWIDFKGKEIRIEQDPNFNDGKLMITVHKPNESYHAKLLVDEESDSKQRFTGQTGKFEQSFKEIFISGESND